MRIYEIDCVDLFYAGEYLCTVGQLKVSSFKMTSKGNPFLEKIMKEIKKCEEAFEEWKSENS